MNCFYQIAGQKGLYYRNEADLLSALEGLDETADLSGVEVEVDSGEKDSPRKLPSSMRLPC